MAILTINQYIDTIKSFVNNITSNNNSYYLYFGKTTPWTDANGNPDDTLIPTANSSVYSYEQSIFKDLVFGKLIEASDVAFMIPRYNWVSNTVYSAYEQNDPDLYNKNFYVINDNNEVYKCIENNYGAPSTIKPSLTATTGVFSTSDGYIWKYMYTIDSNSNLKFSSNSYIPVLTNSAVQNSAISGSIDYITITDGGNNYQAYTTGFLQGIVNTTILQIGNNASSINNRYTGSSIYLKTGFGAGQLREIASYDGLNKLVTVNNPFNNFMVVNFANTNGVIANNYVLFQNYENLYYLYQKGFFSIGDTIIQSDTQASGTVLTANSTVIRVVKSTTNSFNQTLPVYNTVQSHVLKSGNVNITTGIVSTVLVTNPGSGYSSNATVTFTNALGDTTGTGAAANAHSNSAGRIDNINVTANGSLYTAAPIVTISSPTPIAFNAQTAVASNFITLGANGALFANGDQVTYLVAAGNTVLIGLSNNATYYVTGANGSGIKLALTIDSAPITLSAGLNESGHSFTGQTATAVVSFNQNIYANGGTNFTTDYSNNGYIRVGSNANTNIRRILTVNSSVITVDQPFTANSLANVHYSVPYAADLTSVLVQTANGLIVDTNLTGITIAYNNNAINSLSYIIGERIDMVGSDNISQGANAIVSFANSSTLILSNVNGTFLNGSNNFIRGESSLQKSNIQSVISYPNLTVSNPSGTFLSGQQAFVRSITDSTPVGNATIISSFYTPNELTEYIISPTVTITGDGSNAIAYSTVDTSNGSTNSINNIVVLNPGEGYTYANVSITSNTLFGNGAAASPIISPLSGHGGDPITELGARYAGITVDIDTGENEGFAYPVYGSYRKIGIIENPLYNDVTVTLNSFDRYNLNIANRTSTFNNGEYIFQPQSNTIAVVVSSNSSVMQVKSVQGSFIANTSNDNIVGIVSGATANVKNINTVSFSLLSNVEIVSEVMSGANAQIASISNSTVINLTNVSGRFEANDYMVDYVSNAYANVVTITIANNTVDATSNFGQKFSQLARVTFSSNFGVFQPGETVIQESTNAIATVVNFGSDIDIAYTNANGTFDAGNILTDSTSGATAIVTYANSTYLKLTGATGNFTASDRIINNVNIGADVSNVYSVLVMNDVHGTGSMQTGFFQFFGQSSGAYGYSEIAGGIVYPELVKDSGKVLYMENVAPIAKSNTSKEQVNLIIKF